MKRFSVLVAAFFVIAASSIPPAWIGLGFLYRPSTASTPAWLEVIRVLPDSPAARAGVRPRDAITAINGKSLRFRDDPDVLQFFAALHPGDRLVLHIRRGTAAFDVKVVAAKAPPGAERRWQENRDFINGKH